MAKIRLIPSTIYNGASSYVTISNASNAYHDTDNTSSYATIQNTNASTSSRYVYVRGFDFSSIPSGAIINSFTVKVRGYESGLATSASYAPALCNGTSALSNTTASSNFGTSSSVITVPTGALTWENIVNYGANFGIRLNVKRSSRNTASYIYLQGAEIEVDYTIPTAATVTSTLTGSGTISPSGATQTYEGAEYTLTIAPTDPNETVTATKNGVDITSQLVAHGNETSTSRVLGTYTLESGGFNGSGASYFQGLVGKGVDNTQTTTNYYSSSQSTNAVFTYDMSFSLPSNVNIIRVYCEVNGHAESTSNSSEYMCVQLKSGNTNLSDQINFKNVGTSNSTVTLEAETLPTVAQLQSMVLECTVGYYGGAINGATCYVEYDTGGGTIDHYTYTYTVDGNATIAVVIGSSGGGSQLYIKQNGSWVQATLYQKVNGSWVQVSDPSAVLSTTANYVKAN